MSLAIVGSGFGRTGTASLKRALEILGFGPCHHMEEVLFVHPEHVPLWRAIIDGEIIALDEKGRPAFGISFYAVNKSGAYTGATMWSHRPSGKPAQFPVADAKGARLENTAYLYEGKPTV